MYEELNNFKKFDYKGLSALLNMLDPIEFAIVGSIIGIIISIPLDSTELDALGNFLILIGQEMLTVQSHQRNNTHKPVTKSEMDKYHNEMNLKLEKIINGFKK